MENGPDRLEAIFRRMGEPSWLILRALELVHPIAGIEIMRRVEKLLEDADYPYRRLDPSTLHYALKRMEDDGLVACAGRREVDVPGPRGTVRRDSRAVYVLTGLGCHVLERKSRLELASVRPAWTLAPGLAGVGGKA